MNRSIGHGTSSGSSGLFHTAVNTGVRSREWAAQPDGAAITTGEKRNGRVLLPPGRFREGAVVAAEGFLFE